MFYLGLILLLFLGAKWWYQDNYSRAFEPDVMVYNICGMLDTVNHSCNFLLYVISGSLFRSEFIAMVTCNQSRDVATRGGINNNTMTNMKMPRAFSAPVAVAVHKSASTKTSPSGSMLSFHVRRSPTAPLPSLKDVSPNKGKLTLFYQIQPP